MLIEDINAMAVDPILALVSGGRGSRRIECGCYLIGHFGGSHFMRGYDQYPELESVESFGVCDSWEQLKEKCKELHDPDRRFVVTLTEIRREDEPDEGGWRWHKWGPYIGNHKIECEYLKDEVGIESVCVYHIYEKK